MTVRAGAVLLLAAVLAGCLPSSQRENDRSVSAADSASAAVAETVPTDALAVVWTAQAPETDPMPVPTTLVWAGDTLVVVETQEGSLRRFAAADGAYRGRTDLPAESYPYAAGALGDTVVVLARGLDRLLWTLPAEGVVRSEPVAEGATAALVTPRASAVRVGGGPSEQAPEVVVDGVRHPLSGPAWRALGRLVAWGDTVVALSGYRPVVDVLPPDAAAGAPLDTLALVGFASPQLVRSAQFMRGEVDEPPLLTADADALGDRLFVLNLRTDRLRVDVYGRDGRLRRILEGPISRALETDVAFDLAVRRGPGGAVELAVLYARTPGLMTSPASRVVLYRWDGEQP